jgi:hypothetical protein
MPVYTLPELTYDYAALEPHISARIMELHHSKHHAAYVAGANAALEQMEEARANNSFGAKDTVDPAIIGGNQHAETDSVTGFQPLEFLRLLHIEGHGHGRHETRNLLMLHHHRTPLRLHPPHHSADRILSGYFFNRRATRRRSRGLWLAAKQTKSEGCGEE